MCAWLRIAVLNASAKRSRVASLSAVAWCKELLGLLPKRGDRLTQLQELLFRLAHQFHEDVPVPAALATKAAHDFFQLLLEAMGLVRELRGLAAAPRCNGAQSARAFFLRLIQGGGIGDPLAPLFTREGVDDEMGWADKTFVHRRRRLDGDQLIHEGLVNAAAKLAERLG